MKNKLVILLLIMFNIVWVSAALTIFLNKDKKEETNELNIVTTFYPIYTIANNLVTGIDHVNLINMTENATGCLHDYQMTTNDMKKLENADILIMNGGGMESFIEDIAKTYPNLRIINASDGIQLIKEAKEADEESVKKDDVKESEDYNAHVWLNMDKYQQQIENVKNGLIKLDRKNKSLYEKNAKVYTSKINQLNQELKETLYKPVNDKVIIFHDAFSYLAEELGIEVAYSVEIEADTSLSAGDIAKVIDEIKRNNIKVLLTEKQYGDAIAKSIANETNAKVYTIDSLVSGKPDKDSYINGMKKNIEVLKKALYE
ncbi:metal ABC transporter substrate-binding protein [Anaeromicropila herbilytica]|uniref:Zinc ABC transporter substrate-binding protein n=1 Tax=Anaeromicropila herbilytica TaxID=2785025 RepID=A0A7R7EJE3_9FIRM|nr:metal ABC transporter substrate-binding protein [Anaeromicropila herbilytica]BCN29804.1 zinc ABC transporter substrate-binding protein [Anaeromicropila herbilytica]